MSQIPETSASRCLTADGNFITEFGSAGLRSGQFDEPVGIAVDKNGTVYVVDTWNQRIQTFTPIETEGDLSFVPDKQWDVYGWFGQSLDNKPFIAVNDDLHVFITDPDGYRVMEFDQNGTLIRVWDDLGTPKQALACLQALRLTMKVMSGSQTAPIIALMRFTLP